MQPAAPHQSLTRLQALLSAFRVGISVLSKSKNTVSMIGGGDGDCCAAVAALAVRACVDVIMRRVGVLRKFGVEWTGTGEPSPSALLLRLLLSRLTARLVLVLLTQRTTTSSICARVRASICDVVCVCVCVDVARLALGDSRPFERVDIHLWPAGPSSCALWIRIRADNLHLCAVVVIATIVDKEICVLSCVAGFVVVYVGRIPRRRRASVVAACCLGSESEQTVAAVVMWCAAGRVCVARSTCLHWMA